ncbi:mycofactocin biosynthesis glycosyltransferase MftF [Nocardia sp. NPDC058518]|uniref:mycofactocin biosynthesis glycosyltransferase MftF n=1 Tax=Nocardia sp. NPDC058518 TaxID=3346534 RepID=UPI0036699700
MRARRVGLVSGTPQSDYPPPELRLELDVSVCRHSEGSVLLGGSPLRMLRLAAPGVDLLNRWLAGAPVGTTPAARGLARRLLDIGLVHPRRAPGLHTTADVTLVVPVKDNAVGVAWLLAATTDLYQRIVVDDGSTPPLAAATLRHHVPHGPAAARNTGFRQAKTDLIAFIDSDVEPDPGWLASILPLFDDPAVAAVAPRVRGSAVSRQSRGIGAELADYEVDRSSLDMGPHCGVVRPMTRIGYVPTAALVVRRAALIAIGGFDEKLRFGEDVDLVWRLVDSGWLVRYQPDAVVRHQPRETLRAWLRQRFDYGTSAAPLALRHPGRLTCARLNGWSALSWGLVVAGRPGAALGTGAVSTALAYRALRRHSLPAVAAVSVAGQGHLAAGQMLAAAVRRTWWPVALLTRAGRRAVLFSMLNVLAEAVAGRRGARWTLLRIADDVAYSAGVWAGCRRHRTLAPLLPRIITSTPPQ